MEDRMAHSTLAGISQQHGTSGEFRFARQGAARRKTLLLVEDDDDLRLVMDFSLTAMGYAVIACADAHLASTAFHTHVIDVLVTDFEMPRKSGLELARELTALQPALPVVVITGSLLPAEMLWELRDRNWIYIRKPSDMSLVRSILASITA
jgi:DNA-binding NtrC family response regulator